MAYFPQHRPWLMGILNCTPDSFSGSFASLDRALCAASDMLDLGVDVIDIGGESTRPGATTIPDTEELNRVMPVIQEIRQQFPHAILSVDSRKASVARAALLAGVQIVNDVSGLQYDPTLADVVAEFNADLILMHSQGTPDIMQIQPDYPKGVVPTVKEFFEQQINVALQAGVLAENITLDPGFGFGKTIDHNFELLHALKALKGEFPILVGLSRKGFLTLGEQNILPADREALTAVAITLAIQNGADAIRVHDVQTQGPVLKFLRRYRETGLLSTR